LKTQQKSNKQSLQIVIFVDFSNIVQKVRSKTQIEIVRDNYDFAEEILERMLPPTPEKDEIIAELLFSLKEVVYDEKDHTLVVWVGNYGDVHAVIVKAFTEFFERLEIKGCVRI
jgi:hypothetical protein